MGSRWATPGYVDELLGWMDNLTFEVANGVCEVECEISKYQAEELLRASIRLAGALAEALNE